VTKVAGLVLAGGQATRMGGGQKALIEMGGSSLLTRVLERLAPQVDLIAINANRELERYQAFGHPVLTDTLKDFPGPLAGVLAGMHWGQSQGCSHILSVASDTPFFPMDLAARMEATPATIRMAATLDPERGILRQPTFALWPVQLADDLENALKEGLRKIVLWANRHGVEEVVFEPDPIDPFFNLNTPGTDMWRHTGFERFWCGWLEKYRKDRPCHPIGDPFD